jgi:hypothetical protein
MAPAISGRLCKHRRMNPFRRVRDDFRRPVGIPLGVRGPAGPAEHAANLARRAAIPTALSCSVLSDLCNPCNPRSNPSRLGGAIPTVLPGGDPATPLT